MKNTLFLLIAFTAAFHSFAQPTLTAATSNPVAGDIYYGRTCDVTGISKGASGPSVTWNLGGLTTMSLDTTFYLTCAATPYCDTFPGSTLSDSSYGTYDYFIADANKLAYAGYGDPSGSAYYPDPQSMMMYPMTYSNVKVDTYISNQPAFQAYSRGIDSFYADAYGTLILPTGTYSNVLRVHIVNYEIDSFTFTSPATIDTTRNEVYFWYTAGLHVPLLSMTYDTSFTGISHLVDVTYYLYAPTGITDVNDNGVQLQVFPNPANDIVHLKLNLQQGGEISVDVLDMVGRKAGNTRHESVNTDTTDINYDISSLANGMYIIKVQTPSGTELRKIQILK